MTNSKILLLPVIGATTFFILLFLFTKIFGPIPFSVSSVVTTKSETFNVSGEGKVSVVPDIAVVNVGVQTQGASVKALKDSLNTNINKVIDAVKKLGIKDSDIQTSNYNINPNFDSTLKGYTATTNLTIKVREIDKANSIVDSAVASGANQIGGVSFDVDDRTKAENEARQKAVSDAKAKAESAAKIAGFKLGRIINYSENFGGGPIPVPLRAQIESSDKTATQIEPGSSEIVINVTLSFEIL